MSDDAGPDRVAVIWSPEARAELRAIKRETAMQVLYCVDRYLTSRAGDVKKLKPPQTGFRLRWATIECSSITKTRTRLRSLASVTAARPTAEPRPAILAEQPEH